jgi:hypothetical protein
MKIFERGTLDTPSTHKYCMRDWSLSWFVPDPRRGCGFPTSYVVIFLCSVGSVQYLFVLLILVELLTFLLFKLFNVNPNNQIKHLTLLLVQWGGLRGRDRLVVGFTTTYAISAYHHWCCELESRSWRGVQHYEIKFVSNLRLTTILMTHLLNHVIHTSFFK